MSRRKIPPKKATEVDTPYSKSLAPIQGQIRQLLPEDLPAPEVLSELGIEPQDFGNFYKALHFAILQAGGCNISDAALGAGIERSRTYDKSWQTLLAAAQRLLVGRAMLEVQGVTSKVLERWPAVVDQLLKDAISAPRAMDRIKATELIYGMFISNAEPMQDASAERHYLQGSQNFNPAQPMLVAQQMTVNITNNQSANSAGVTVDGEIVQTNDDLTIEEPPSLPQ